MIRLSELRLALDHSEEDLCLLACKTLGCARSDLLAWHIHKRSFDARKSHVLAVYILDVECAPALEVTLLQRAGSVAHIQSTPDMQYRLPLHLAAPVPQRPVVVGFGPCGIFAALILAQMGLRPIVLERGKPVRQRTQDTWALWRRGVLDPESNVQFGEGGAGTFSDGKLYSQIKDPRFLGRKVMQELVAAGAPANILIDAHPHIGTFKLVKVVENLRARILALGGEIRFQQRVTDLILEGPAAAQGLVGLCVLDQATGANYTLDARQVVLALGHSARDTFAMLHARAVGLQAKPFSVGFRIEHPQSLIDRARWGRHAGSSQLGAADYKLVHHAGNGRTVYSFCMCPGGTVVAATSEAGRVVTNGMSQYSRKERNANAGIVVGITPADFADPAHPLSGVALQRTLESQAFFLGGQDYRAPAQLVGDFLNNQASTQFGSVLPSYRPGVNLASLARALPDYAIAAIREALPEFGKKIHGFDMPEAVLTGVETRTSSPLRIVRGEDFQSVNTSGLYPAGEGAGYAGGILSAAVDGIKVAEALARAWAVGKTPKESVV